MREIGETRMLEPFAPSFASWNVLADRYSRRQNVEDKKEKYANVCDIVFGILDEKSVVGSCVFLQEVEPLLHAALVERKNETVPRRHHVYCVPHGDSVWPVDECPWSLTSPKGWSGTSTDNVGNAIILNIGYSDHPLIIEERYSLDEQYSSSGEPEGNIAAVIRWGERMYISAHLCTLWSPWCHHRQIQRLRQFLDSNRPVVIGADLNSPCVFARTGRPRTWPLWPCPMLAIDSIISNSIVDLSAVKEWTETKNGRFSDHIGVRCYEYKGLYRASDYAAKKWEILLCR
jgi:endonuclease/exonuclease/phosphatase family metal-dependent hydrolase